MEEKHGYFLEDMEVGMTAIYAKTVTDADIVMFAGISGDTVVIDGEALLLVSRRAEVLGEPEARVEAKVEAAE